MIDIVERLTKWSISTDAVPASDLMDEAAVEIARLRAQLLAAYQLGIRHRDPPDLRSGAAESRETVQLTDAERSAIADAADRYAETAPESAETAATLRALLSRTGSNSRQTCDEAIEFHSQGEKTPERDRLTDAERKALTEASEFYIGTRTGLALSDLLKRLAQSQNAKDQRLAAAGGSHEHRR